MRGTPSLVSTLSLHSLVRSGSYEELEETNVRQFLKMSLAIVLLSSQTDLQDIGQRTVYKEYLRLHLFENT